ncbi:peptidoglycan-binding protein [Dactylosporangium sp. NPDC051485]|uniref:peptidoglycan-binding protein n=1 Tax=Dactylosporangium sp. NPDC051485 TaxID=3154846 RepID=UPI003417E52D
MARWKPLPEGLDPQARQLAVRLRELRDKIGISTATLARKTPYSRSSWERYFNGTTRPPRSAVEALGRLSDADLPHVLALWELADRCDPPAPLPQDGPGPAPAAAPVVGRRRRRWPALAAAAGLAVIAVAGTVVWLLLPRGSTPSRPAADTAPTGYDCTYATHDGRLYGGHSDTSDRLVALNGGSQDVVEVQCLLKHHGLDPGRIDGLFGKQTEQAVEDLQRANGLVVDGIVGPQTWVLLRA